MSRPKKKPFHPLALVLAVGFPGLMAPRAAFASTDNCSASQLPWSQGVAVNVKSSAAKGSAIGNSDTFTSIAIHCPSTWSDGEGASCAGSPNWSIVPTTNVINTTAYPGVYTTPGMPDGLGYQLLDAAGNPLPLDNAGQHDTGVAIRSGAQSVPVHFRVVKIADRVASTRVALNMYLTCTNNEWAAGSKDSSVITFQLASETVTQTCSMVLGNLQVTLPPVYATDFAGVGSAIGNQRAVLEFQCDARADAKINFTDATDASNAGTALKLLAGSSATGVGVRLTVDGTPVALSPNEAFNSGGTEVPLQNSTSTAAREQIPFSAQYVQTGTRVTPGTVQARSLVNISYN